MEAEPLGEWQPPGLEQPSNVWSAGQAIVLDFGSWRTRVGMAAEADLGPRHDVATRAAKFRDRRAGRTTVVVGNDILLDQSARQNARSVYDGPLAANWDTAELVLDYSFDLLGVSSRGHVDSPLVIGETFLNPHPTKNTLAELCFEGYGVPKLAVGSGPIHSHLMDGTGMVVSAGHEATHIVPWVDGKPQLSSVKRINWGGRQATDLLHQLLVLKYPLFPTRVTVSQVEQLMQRHCFIAEDYRQFVDHALDLDVLEQVERRIQAPVSVAAPRVSEEEVARRRAESGQRLREQAARARERRRAEQDAELASFRELVDACAEAGDEADAVAQQHGYESLSHIRRAYRKADNAVRKSRGEETLDEEPDTSLLGIPDEELDADQQREKRRQRLLKASWDARQRQKQAKAAQREAQQHAEAQDREWRERDLAGWAQAKRAQLQALQRARKDRQRLQNDPATRRSMQLRSFLSAESSLQNTPGGRKRRRKAGAAVGESGERVESLDELEAMEDEGDTTEDTEDAEVLIDELQAQLLEYDPTYTIAEAEDRPDWRQSTVHKFIWGAHDVDPDNALQMHQLCLNIERARVPEALFQPPIAGLDQAGLGEVCSELATKVFPLEVGQKMVSNVWLTGGLARLPGLGARLKHELMSSLPAGTPVSVQQTERPDWDSWRGLATWATKTNPYVTKREYEEFGVSRLHY